MYGIFFFNETIRTDRTEILLFWKGEEQTEQEKFHDTFIFDPHVKSSSCTREVPDVSLQFTSLKYRSKWEHNFHIFK